MLITVFIILCLSISSRADPLLIYIDSTASPDNQNGAPDSPFVDFPEALENISISLQTQSVTVLFAPTLAQYNFSLNINFTGLSTTSVLNLTTNGGDDSITCEQYATIVIGEVPSAIYSDNLTISFSNLIIINQFDSSTQNNLNISTTGKLSLSFLNDCMNFTSVGGYVFKIYSNDTAYFQIHNFNLTNIETENIPGYFLYANIENVVQFNMTDCNMYIPTIDGVFSFLELYGNAQNQFENHITIENINITRDVSPNSNLSKSSIFYIENFENVTIKNFSSQYIGQKTTFFELTNIVGLFAANLNVYNSNFTNFSTVIVFSSEISNVPWIVNSAFSNVSNLRLFLVEGSLGNMEIENFTISNSTLHPSNSLITYSFLPTFFQLSILLFTRFTILNCSLGTLITAAQIGTPIFTEISPYEIIFQNLQVNNSIFTQNSIFDTTPFQLVIVDSIFSDCKISKQAALIVDYSGADGGNIFISNTIFRNLDIGDSSLIQRISTVDSSKETLIYRIMAIRGCLFQNIDFHSSNFAFIYNEMPFSIFTENIMINSSYDMTNFLQLSQKTSSKYFKRDISIENLIFKQATYLKKIFDEVLDPNSTFCKTPCYFNYIAKNTLTTLKQIGTIFNLANTNNGVKSLILNNTYTNIFEGGMYIISNPTLANSTYIYGEILVNLALMSHIGSFMGSMETTLLNGIYYNSTIGNILIYQNLTQIIQTPLPGSTKMNISNNIFYNCTSRTAFQVTIQYADLISFANNTFGNYTVYSESYVQINLIQLSVSNSVLDIIFDGNSFFDINISNNFNRLGFFPSLSNSMIGAKLLDGVKIIIRNSVFQNLKLDAILSYLFYIQSESITFENITIERVKLNNTQGFSIYMISPVLIISQLTVKDCSIQNWKSFIFGSQGFMFLSYINVYNLELYNNVSIDTLDLSNWNQGHFLVAESTFLQISVTNANIIGTNQVFFVNSLGGIMNYQNISYNSQIGLFMGSDAPFSEPTTIFVSNYSQINQNGITPVGSAFDIRWENLNFTAQDLNLTNIPFLKAGKFSGNVLIQNVNCQGDTSTLIALEIKDGNPSTNVTLTNFTIYYSFSYELLQLNTTGSPYLNVSRIIMQNSWIKTPFALTIFNNSYGFEFNLDSIIVSHSYGYNFITLANGDEIGYLSLSNMIFHDSGYSILSNQNANLEMTNIIQINEGSVIQIVDSGNQNQFTQLSNIIVHNVTSIKNYIELDQKSVSIDSLIYTSNQNGLYVNQSDFIVNSSIFYGNVNPNPFGGCVNAQNSTVIVTNTTIMDNFAPVGGFLFENLTEYSGSLSIINSTVAQNYAYFYGNLKASQVWSVELKTNLTPNTNKLFDDYYKISLELVSTGYQLSEYKLNNASVAAALNNFFILSFTDYNNQEILFGNTVPLSLVAEDPLTGFSTIFTTGDRIQNAVQFLASNLTFPQANSNLTVSLNTSLQGMNVQIILNINSRGCLDGEVLDEDTGFCEMCPYSYYSLNTTQQCQLCPLNCICPGGKYIQVAPNFWREPGTAVIFPCLNDGVERCVGGIDAGSQCAQGYSGALCLGCDFAGGYFPDNGNVCALCSDFPFWIWVKNILILILSYLFELVYIYFAYISNNSFVNRIILGKGDSTKYYESEDYLISVRFFLFANFLHIILLIITYASYIETNLVVVLDELQIFLIFATGSTVHSSDFTCWLSNMGVASDNLTYFQVKFSTYFPLFKIAITCAVLLIVHFFSEVTHRRTKISIIVITIILLDQNYLLQTLSQISTCINGEISGYSQMDPNINCQNARYQDFISSFVDPMIIFWGLFIPVIFMTVLFIYRNRRKEIKVRLILGGLMNNFEDKAYYWGLVFFLLKQALLIAFTLISDPRNATTVTILIMGIYCYMSSQVQPYHDKKLNNADKYSSFAIYISLIIFNQAIGNVYPGMTTFYVVVIFVIYSIVILYLGVPAFLSLYRRFWRIVKARRDSNNDLSLSVNSVDSNTSINEAKIGIRDSYELADFTKKI